MSDCKLDKIKMNFLVYEVWLENELIYIGYGKQGTETLVNSGISNNYFFK